MKLELQPGGNIDNHADTVVTVVFRGFINEFEAVLEATVGEESAPVVQNLESPEAQHRRMIDAFRAEFRAGKKQNQEEREESSEPIMREFHGGPFSGDLLPCNPHVREADIDGMKFVLQPNGHMQFVPTAPEPGKIILG